MRVSLISVFFVTFLSSFAGFQTQSSFKGPLELKVWKHWQPSWNVDAQTAPWGFVLTRNADGETGQVSLRFYDQRKTELTGTLQCHSLKRTDTWKVETKVGKELTKGSFLNPEGEAQFIWDDANDCIDVTGKNITQKIVVRVTDKLGKELFSETLLPMYVRGKNHAYWNNAIPAYSAHSGSGSISVATLLSGESGWDMWNGTLVKPTLSFADRNTMKAESVIGLHRHESNQEAYFIESGEAEMAMGVSHQVGTPYKALHQWDEKGDKKETDEFTAKGGWKETRRLLPGEMAIIVPNPNDKESVFFHGIRAMTDTVFWTMGSRN